jgi:hypothetical protein
MCWPQCRKIASSSSSSSSSRRRRRKEMHRRSQFRRRQLASLQIWEGQRRRRALPAPQQQPRISRGRTATTTRSPTAGLLHRQRPPLPLPAAEAAPLEAPAPQLPPSHHHLRPQQQQRRQQHHQHGNVSRGGPLWPPRPPLYHSSSPRVQCSKRARRARRHRWRRCRSRQGLGRHRCLSSVSTRRSSSSSCRHSRLCSPPSAQMRRRSCRLNCRHLRLPSRRRQRSLQRSSRSQ